MKLFEHEDFGQLITLAREHHEAQGVQLPEQFIEKDYYLTEALRLIAGRFPHEVIFKGGTSLSKGWGLIQRFSEDVDIFLNPDAFDPPLSKRGIDRTLKEMRDFVESHPALTYDRRANPRKGFGRQDFFVYMPRYEEIAAVAPTIFVESGIGSGTEPTETVPLQSFVGRFLTDTGQSVNADDEGPFTMKLLHFRRTFVEKLFTVHKIIAAFEKGGPPLGTHARHYYDLYQLGQQIEVREMLQSDEYATIKGDYDRVTKEFFPTRYVPPENMSFANSNAIFPTGQLRSKIIADYSDQCGRLCYGPVPSWSEVEGLFNGLRPYL
jgi:predicted nucleotidyltransferase component of viral defense system